MNEQILNLLSGSVASMQQMLWPRIVESILDAKFSEALPALCQSIASLGTKLLADNATTHHSVDGIRVGGTIGRLIVVLCEPYRDGVNIGQHYIDALDCIGKLFVVNWDAVRPFLEQPTVTLKDCGPTHSA